MPGPLRTALSTVFVVSLATGVAFAAGGHRPEPSSPADHATTSNHAALTFRVSSTGGAGDAFVVVARSRAHGSDGVLAGQAVVYKRMLSPRGAGAEHRVEHYPALGTYWLNRPAPSFWQAFRGNCADAHALHQAAGDCQIAGPVRKLSVRRAATTT